MPLQYSITKVTATGESIIVHIGQCHPVSGEVMHSVEEMDAMLQKASDSTTERMFDMNMAMLEAYHLDAYFDPGVWLRVKQVMEVLAGRMQAQVLQHRWESAREETAEMERMRAVHAQQQVGLQSSVPLNMAPISTVVPEQELRQMTVDEQRQAHERMQHDKSAENEEAEREEFYRQDELYDQAHTATGEPPSASERELQRRLNECEGKDDAASLP